MVVFCWFGVHHWIGAFLMNFLQHLASARYKFLLWSMVFTLSSYGKNEGVLVWFKSVIS
jgi:hypothetical protein